MITSILEFKFSNHYSTDPDNRFTTRLKNVNILNNVIYADKAKERLLWVLYYYGMVFLNDLHVFNANVGTVGIVFPELKYKENGVVKKFKLTNGKGEFNTYVAIVNKNTVVTIYDINDNDSNDELLRKANINHKVEKIQSIITAKILTGESTDRGGSIIIDLDCSDEEFKKSYPLKSIDNNILPEDKSYLIKGENDIKSIKGSEPSMSPKPIEGESAVLVGKRKEFVIQEGSTVLVNTPVGLKPKTIMKIIANGSKYSLEFVNTLKILDLTLGSQFVISPAMKNEELVMLLKQFDLSLDSKIHFQGPIVSFNYYKKGKGGSDKEKLGIIIEPRLYFTNSALQSSNIVQAQS